MAAHARTAPAPPSGRHRAAGPERRMSPGDWPSSALRTGGPQVSLTMFSGFPRSRGLRAPATDGRR
ncbi:predicted protein [Streptomyces lividans TK24]|nr:predicted protein [Streptomyces lividans TK24]